MEKSNDISKEPNKANASHPVESKTRQELLNTNKFLYIASIGCAILAALCIILGIIIQEFFGLPAGLFLGLPAGIFLILFIIFIADTQKHKMRRTTFYTIMSFMYFGFGVVFFTLGEHVHSTFGVGITLIYGAGAWACIMSFIFILSDGEIIKISGIVKLICLILIMSLAMKYCVWRLNKVRQKNFSSKYDTPAATVSHPNPLDGNSTP